jgi:hypothetical protein
MLLLVCCHKAGPVAALCCTAFHSQPGSLPFDMCSPLNSATNPPPGFGLHSETGIKGSRRVWQVRGKSILTAGNMMVCVRRWHVHAACLGVRPACCGALFRQSGFGVSWWGLVSDDRRSCDTLAASGYFLCEPQGQVLVSFAKCTAMHVLVHHAALPCSLRRQQAGAAICVHAPSVMPVT